MDLYSKMEVPKIQKRRVKERLKPYVKDQWAVDLLDRLLTLNPSARIDSDTALNHDFFWSDPMPQSLEKMLSQHTQVTFAVKPKQTIHVSNFAFLFAEHV